MKQQVENPQPVSVTQSFEILFEFFHSCLQFIFRRRLPMADDSH